MNIVASAYKTKLGKNSEQAHFSSPFWAVHWSAAAAGLYNDPPFSGLQRLESKHQIRAL